MTEYYYVYVMGLRETSVDQRQNTYLYIINPTLKRETTQNPEVNFLQVYVLAS